MTGDGTTILGVDPGTTTGLAVATFDPKRDGEPAAVWSDQLDWEVACERISFWLERMRTHRDYAGVEVIAVGEQFQINANTARRGQQGAEDAMGILGVLRYICGLTNVEQAPLQQASAAKALVDDHDLRQLSLHSPGMVHANDAYRHVLLLAVKRKIMSPAWLVPEKA